MKEVVYIYLDDVREPLDSRWIVVKNYEQFVKTVLDNKDKKLIISFDHDLADEHYQSNSMNKKYFDSLYSFYEEKTGLSCAKWLIENEIIPEMFYVHSSSYYGSINILSLLNNWFKSLGISKRGVKAIVDFKLSDAKVTFLENFPEEEE